MSGKNGRSTPCFDGTSNLGEIRERKINALCVKKLTNNTRVTRLKSYWLFKTEWKVLLADPSLGASKKWCPRDNLLTRSTKNSAVSTREQRQRVSGLFFGDIGSLSAQAHQDVPFSELLQLSSTRLDKQSLLNWPDCKRLQRSDWTSGLALCWNTRRSFF